MGVRDLFFAIKARDETGAAFNAVRANLRGVDGMAATASSRLAGVGRGLIGFGAAATAATAPILFAFRDSLSLYDTQERAQAKVEGRNFDIRKQLLKFDDVQNDQRKVIFGQRREIMEADDLAEIAQDMRHQVIDDLVDAHIPAKSYADQWDGEGPTSRFWRG